MGAQVFAERCLVELEDQRLVDGYVYEQREGFALVSFQRAAPGILTMGWWPVDRVRPADRQPG